MDIILSKLKKALRTLENKDLYLVEKDLHERTIVCKLANYLQTEFEGLDVDVEYNKNADVSKKIIKNSNENNDEEISVYPDIIIHKRGTSENRLIVEVKKKTNSKNREFDMYKIIQYLNPKNNLKYENGIFIDLGCNEKGLDCEISPFLKDNLYTRYDFCKNLLVNSFIKQNKLFFDELLDKIDSRGINYVLKLRGEKNLSKRAIAVALQSNSTRNILTLWIMKKGFDIEIGAKNQMTIQKIDDELVDHIEEHYIKIMETNE